MALALLLHGQKSLFGFENGHMKQNALHKVHINSAKFWGIKIGIYLTTEVPMGININQPGVQRNRCQMTPSTMTMFTSLFALQLSKPNQLSRANIKSYASSKALQLAFFGNNN